VTVRTSGMDFTAAAGEYRSELLAHCYRLLGSVHDAEDVVQETYVRAWRAYDSFEGRSSVRRWLYVIATRACLTALDRRSRRPLPSGLAGPVDGEIAWLEPLPDDRLDPAHVVAARAGIRLAFVAALQYLPARQRAALVLCDVLEWPAADAAAMLGTTPAGIAGTLQRARAHLRALRLAEEDLAEPDDLRDLLDRYAAAFAEADVAALAALVRDDVTLEMPPLAEWYAGKDAALGFLAAHVLHTPGIWRHVPTRANDQPAFVVYERGHADPHGLHVLTLRGGRISRITAFNYRAAPPSRPGSAFPRFGERGRSGVGEGPAIRPS
jgi:RNA polymerase sigma-70 factor (ECF subfamily)